MPPFLKFFFSNSYHWNRGKTTPPFVRGISHHTTSITTFRHIHIFNYYWHCYPPLGTSAVPCFGIYTLSVYPCVPVRKRPLGYAYTRGTRSTAPVSFQNSTCRVSFSFFPPHNLSPFTACGPIHISGRDDITCTTVAFQMYFRHFLPP